MLNKSISDRTILFAEVISAAYFLIFFSNVLQYVDTVFVRVIGEFLTIPMIILQLGIIVYMLNVVLIKKLKPSVELTIGSIIAVGIAILITILFLRG
ncbi:MAG: hypothetical protein P0Y49_05720 [Candidatus Pedobacter colombiensis]|uniref:Uncharacterized protein n=1 Tax=Candidatus Pedobacter colombiensis TaxID=3121371 RepID=A0AAJ5W9Y6_9SPHI|nr:hypothetical protein [Pedobacter sp.]WEK20634.1 MAG: hypothetical protein P0Y49_05720 [Pedobacter sp.]